MIMGLLIIVLSVVLMLILNRILLQFELLSESKKRFIQRYYFIFFGLVNIAAGIANQQVRQMWDIFSLMQTLLGIVMVIVCLLFPTKR